MATSNCEELAKIAEWEQKEANHWRRDLETNPTRKRIDEWEHYEMRGIFHQQCVHAAGSLIRLYQGGSMHAALTPIRKRDTLEELVRYAATSPEHRRHDRLMHIPPASLKLFTHQEVAQAFLQYVDIDREEFARQRKLVEVKAKCYRNIGVVQDFFPTPTAAAYELISHSGARNVEGSVLLEPSAGMADLAAIMRYEYGDATLWVCEQQWTMVEYLELEGYNVVGHDFMEFDTPVDHIIMNPPFSNGKDAQHIRHAYDILRPGGSIAALASQSISFNTKGHYKDFMTWWASVGGRSEPLERGLFKGKGININPYLLWLEEKLLPDPEPAQLATGESDQAVGTAASAATAKGGVRPKRKRAKAAAEAA